jgi:hypothetical protein
MPKVNPWAFSRPALPEETRSFEDARNGVTVTMTLRALNVLSGMAASERADEETQRWVTGGDGRPAMTFPAPDGQPVNLTEDICRSLCIIEAMQQGPDEDRYTFMDLVGMMGKRRDGHAALGFPPDHSLGR